MDLGNTHNLEGADYIVEGAISGKDILASMKNIDHAYKEEVVYGVYNNAGKPWSVRFNDFLVDRSKVTLKDRSYFFHMLAVMVDAGIPVVSAVKALVARSDNPRFRRILNTIAHNVESGSSLAEAMNRFDDVFDESEVGIVRSGEATGRLHLMLFKLSEKLDRRHDLSLKLWSAAVYPIAVFSVLILVAVGMLIWVFPTLLNLLKDSGIEEANLPFATRLLIGIQTGFVEYWWLILVVLFGLYGLFTFYVGTDYGKARWDYFKLRTPIVGGLLRKVYVLRFVSMVGLLIDSGLPVIKSLKIAGSSISNTIYKLKVQDVIDKVRNGQRVSDGLSDTAFLFPPEVVQMLRVGESSASLGKVSNKIGDQYDREIDNSLKKISSVFEPVLILVVGVFVALLALAIMAPIFNLSNNIG
ncbi:hypothetical protein COU74_04640 [Candidatus Peregrinibacteria bacterium CG10_big_fil_rev_8_21_14_0_10_36_19]|nr:MAG: hypothetical protein COU74_04640 [Candidatus Peregrinibacteria bacterium CG10_big_fil_rev_8_21_14_0_10_36_19]